MGKLKLGPLEDDKPVKISVELPAALHRDLLAYAEILGRENGQAVEPARRYDPGVKPVVRPLSCQDRGLLGRAEPSLRHGGTDHG